MYFVYILKSKVDGSYYIGQTGNLQKRLNRHNAGRSVYTKTKVPWELVYFEEYESKREALIREKEIKSWKSRVSIEKLVKRPD